MHMMNNGFINRNRIYWMNTHGIADIKVLVNEDLFYLSEETASKDDISINIKHSDKPLAVGVMSYMSNDIREYFAYGNDKVGKIEWLEDFDTFKEAMSFAKRSYGNYINEMYYDYMYYAEEKILKK